MIVSWEYWSDSVQTIVVYDREKVIAKLMDRDQMTHEEALEFYYFNQVGAWVGEKTPAFLIKMSENEGQDPY